MAKYALVTHVQDYVGPSAVDALLQNGFTVLAQAPAFSDEAASQNYQCERPGVITTELRDPQALLEWAWEVSGGLDVLISNDAYPAIHVPVEDACLTDLQATIDSVMVYPFRLMQAAAPRFKAQTHGNIIFVTSCRTELPMPGGAIPDMARAGANALVKSLALELAPFNIPVNAIAPNFLYSEAYFPRAKFIDDAQGADYIRSVVPAGRLGKTEEIGELVSYLANMKGAFHTGTIIKFAGGWPAAPCRPATT